MRRVLDRVFAAVTPKLKNDPSHIKNAPIPPTYISYFNLLRLLTQNVCCMLLYYTFLVFYVYIRCPLFYIILLCAALWKACAFKKNVLSVKWIGFVSMRFVILKLRSECNMPA